MYILTGTLFLAVFFTSIAVVVVCWKRHGDRMLAALAGEAVEQHRYIRITIIPGMRAAQPKIIPATAITPYKSALGRSAGRRAHTQPMIAQDGWKIAA
jgi:hypothetical protein